MVCTGRYLALPGDKDVVLLTRTKWVPVSSVQLRGQHTKPV